MIDLHMHTNCSDGTDSVESLVQNVIDAKLTFFSITDHDTAKACRLLLENDVLKQKLKENNVKFVPGIELSCIYKGRKMHILAYDIDPNHKIVLEFEQKFKDLFNEKTFHRSKAIENDGYVFSQKSKEFLASRINIRTPDVARCLYNDHYFDDYEDACAYVKSIKYPKDYLYDSVEVLKEFSKIGAKLVWAHSLYGVKQAHIDFDKVEEFIKELKPFGLAGLECYYSLYNKAEIDGLRNLAKKYDLFITCGSDYHGTNKSVKLLEHSTDSTKTDETEITIINEFNNSI